MTTQLRIWLYMAVFYWFSQLFKACPTPCDQPFFIKLLGRPDEYAMLE